MQILKASIQGTFTLVSEIAGTDRSVVFPVLILKFSTESLMIMGGPSGMILEILYSMSSVGDVRLVVAARKNLTKLSCPPFSFTPTL